MAKREQIAASAHGTLLSSGSTSVLLSGMLKEFSTMSMFSTQQSLQRSEGMFEKRSFHDHYAKMRTSGLQLCGTEWEEILQRGMCR
jgi:hypothetical protein